MTITPLTDLAEINRLGLRLLNVSRHPIPRWRAVRDILDLSAEDVVYKEAESRLQESKWVKELLETQLPDGTWGRFHSRDSSLHNRFPTTELAIQRALALGLDKESVLLKKSIGYMHAILDEKVTWSDPPEKHEGWPINIRTITASTLARVDPADAYINQPLRDWEKVVAITFRSGRYNVEDERQAHLFVNGIKTRNKFLKLASLYPLMLLSSAVSQLPADLEKTLLEWIWNKNDGIYYVFGCRLSDRPEIHSRHFIDWLQAIELLSRFPSGKNLCNEAIMWLWNQQDAEGWWDFGPKARSSIVLPFSESWKDPINRKIDCSIFVLAILKKFYNIL